MISWSLTTSRLAFQPDPTSIAAPQSPVGVPMTAWRERPNTSNRVTQPAVLLPTSPKFQPRADACHAKEEQASPSSPATSRESSTSVAKMWTTKKRWTVEVDASPADAPEPSRRTASMTRITAPEGALARSPHPAVGVTRLLHHPDALAHRAQTTGPVPGPRVRHGASVPQLLAAPNSHRSEIRREQARLHRLTGAMN